MSPLQMPDSRLQAYPSLLKPIDQPLVWGKESKYGELDGT